MTLSLDGATAMPAPPASPLQGASSKWGDSGWACSYARELWKSGQVGHAGPAGPDSGIEDDPRDVTLHSRTGAQIVLDIARFTAPPCAAEMELLDRCTGPTVDIGCGPGRLAAELAGRGVPTLGVDVSPVAVLFTRAAGATALRRSIFDRLPGEGRWHHALLIDGNIGIGGDPAALLSRVKQLLRPEGAELLVETEATDIDELHWVRASETGTEFGWARIGAKALAARAEGLGYRIRSSWRRNGRCFTVLAV